MVVEEGNNKKRGGGKKVEGMVSVGFMYGRCGVDVR